MSNFTRRGLLKTGATVGAGLAMPTLITSPVAAYTNEPKGGSVTLGFNVPQSGPYADEGADELRAYKLAVEHLNGGGDGGMMNTFSSKALKGCCTSIVSRSWRDLHGWFDTLKRYDW